MNLRWMSVGAMLVAFAVGITSVGLGIEASNAVTGTIDGYIPELPFMFGTVALLAALGDARLLLARGLQGAQRLARHLWRMCFALWIAAGSFFLGQAQLFPEPVRITPLLALPVLLVLLLMLYWLVRVLLMQWHARV